MLWLLLATAVVPTQAQDDTPESIAARCKDVPAVCKLGLMASGEKMEGKGRRAICKDVPAECRLGNMEGAGKDAWRKVMKMRNNPFRGKRDINGSSMALLARQRRKAAKKGSAWNMFQKLKEEGEKKDEPPTRKLQMCCRAFTAQCLSCVEGKTIAEFCAQRPEVVGCPERTNSQGGSSNLEKFPKIRPDRPEHGTQNLNQLQRKRYAALLKARAKNGHSQQKEKENAKP